MVPVPSTVHPYIEQLVLHEHGAQLNWEGLAILALSIEGIPGLCGGSRDRPECKFQVGLYVSL